MRMEFSVHTTVRNNFAVSAWRSRFAFQVRTDLHCALLTAYSDLRKVQAGRQQRLLVPVVWAALGRKHNLAVSFPPKPRASIHYPGEALFAVLHQRGVEIRWVGFPNRPGRAGGL